MSKPLSREPILSLEAIAALQNARLQILDAVAGKVPKRLTRTTVGAAVRLARREATPEQVLSGPVLYLVLHSLMTLSQDKWKPSTALLLRKRGKEGGHGPRR